MTATIFSQYGINAVFLLSVWYFGGAAVVESTTTSRTTLAPNGSDSYENDKLMVKFFHCYSTNIVRYAWTDSGSESSKSSNEDLSDRFQYHWCPPRLTLTLSAAEHQQIYHKYRTALRTGRTFVWILSYKVCVDQFLRIRQTAHDQQM